MLKRIDIIEDIIIVRIGITANTNDSTRTVETAITMGLS